MSKQLYSVNWTALKIETATLLDEHNMNEGASVETWLCKDSNGRKFTCSKFDCGWQFSELAAWHDFEAEIDQSIKSSFAELLKMQKQYEEAVNIHLAVKQKILDLKLAAKQ